MQELWNCRVKMAIVQTEYPIPDAENVIFIKEELVDTDDVSQFSDQSDSNPAPGTVKDEENPFVASPQSHMYFNLLSCEDGLSGIKWEPEVIIEETGHKVYYCFYCQQACASLLRLKKHIKMKHSHQYRSGKLNEDKIKSFGISDGSVTTHAKPNLFLFPPCDYLIEGSADSISHIISEDTFEKYSCSVCNFRTGKSSHLKRHIMLKHCNEKPYSCPHCDYRAARHYQLTAHIKGKHSEDKPYSCHLCDYRSSRNGDLKSHLIGAHNNTKPYSCPFCDYRAARNYHLNAHIKGKHTGEKPYSCHLCNYKSTRNGDLKIHIIATHTNEKPHPCPHCEYRTARSGHLKTHIMSKHTKEKPFSCHLCDYRTTRNGDLKRHILAVH